MAGRSVLWGSRVAGCWLVALASCIGSEPAVSSQGPSDASTDASTGATSVADATVCPSSQTMCGAVCSTIASDPSNCGGCGNVCAAGQACVSGHCGTVCGRSQTLCTPDAGDAGAFCANVATDNANCGTCGNACPVGQACAGGSCTRACSEGSTPCQNDAGVSSCVDTGSDSLNCGGCGNACAAGYACVAGSCSQSCAGGQTLCVPDAGGAYCASTETDSLNCGVCGNACTAGTLCSSGACVNGCGANEVYCAPDGGAGDSGAYCADIQADNANCGSCGNACASGTVCSGGSCTNQCGSGETYCAPDASAPYCSNLKTDNANCGACGTACPVGEGCISGACTPGCFLGGTGTSCTVDSQCASDSCANGTCQALGALVLKQVDGAYIAADAFNDGTTYTYVAFAPNGSTPTIMGGSDVTFETHGGGGSNPYSSFLITSSSAVTSISISTASQSAFTIHDGSIFFDGTWDPTPADATHTIPTGQSLAWGFGFTEDLGTSNWYASVDDSETSYTDNVHVHEFDAPISPGTTHIVMAAGFTSGGYGIQAAYWGYSHDAVTCP